MARRTTKAQGILADAKQRVVIAEQTADLAWRELETAKAKLEVCREFYADLEKALAPTPRKSATKQAAKKASKGAAKSTRASSPEKAIKGTASKPLDGGVSKIRCGYTGESGIPCGEYADSGVHNVAGGYMGYHEFVGEAAQAASGD